MEMEQQQVLLMVLLLMPMGAMFVTVITPPTLLAMVKFIYQKERTPFLVR